jgi:hypothetical protein
MHTWACWLQIEATMRFLPVLALLSLSLFACGEDDKSSSSPTANDDTNELNARKLQVFDCKTETQIDGAIQNMQFSIKNITNNRAIEIFDKNGQEPEDYNPVSVQPEGRIGSLNENLSVSTGTRQLRISGDSDGFYLLDLVLYKNSEYKKGYLRISHDMGDGGNAYAKVNCTVTERNR